MPESEVNPVETTIKHHSNEVNGIERFSAEVTILGEASAADPTEPSAQ